MDAFDLDNVKAEKANAMLRYHRLRNIAKLFRIVEFCLAVVFLSWTSARLPFAVRISGEYFRRLVAFIVSPLFIFLLSNVIVLTLLIKSGQFSGQSPSINNAETDLYEEIIKDTHDRINFGLNSSPPEPEPVEIVYQDKQIISEVNTAAPSPNYETTAVAMPNDPVPEPKVFRRSQSENLRRESSEKHCEKLRRSETEECRKVVSSGGNPEEKVYVADELSGEEFQRAIEAFIAKQVKFHQEEKLAIVLHSQA